MLRWVWAAIMFDALLPEGLPMRIRPSLACFCVVLAGCYPIIQPPQPTYIASTDCPANGCGLTVTIEPNNADVRSVSFLENGVGVPLTRIDDQHWKLLWRNLWGVNGDIEVGYRGGFPNPVSSRSRVGTFQVPILWKGADTDHDAPDDRYDRCPFLPESLTPGPAPGHCEGPELNSLSLTLNANSGFFAVVRDNTGPAMFTDAAGVTYWAFKSVESARMLLSAGNETWRDMTPSQKLVTLRNCKLVWSDDAQGYSNQFVEVYAADPGNGCSFHIARIGANGGDEDLLTGEQVLFYVVTPLAPGYLQGKAMGYGRVTLIPPAAGAPDEARGLYNLLTRANPMTKYVYFVLDRFEAAATVPVDNCGPQGTCVTANFQGRGRMIYRIPPP